MGDQAYTRTLKISIHALREEGDFAYLKISKNPHISIHALREEGDLMVLPKIPLCWKISIHALREEGDAVHADTSTAGIYFYPRPPRGGRQLHWM